MNFIAIHVYMCLGFVESRFVFTKPEIPTYPTFDRVEFRTDTVLSKKFDYSIERISITKTENLKNLAPVDGSITNLSSPDVSSNKNVDTFSSQNEAVRSNKNTKFSLTRRFLSAVDMGETRDEAISNISRTKIRKRAALDPLPTSQRKSKLKSSKRSIRQVRPGFRRRYPGRQARVGSPNQSGQRHRVNKANLRYQRQGSNRKLHKPKGTKKIASGIKRKKTRKQRQSDTQDIDRGLKNDSLEKDLPVKDEIPPIDRKKDENAPVAKNKGIAPVADAKKSEKTSNDAKSPVKDDNATENPPTNKNGANNAIVGGVASVPGKKDADTDPADPETSKKGNNSAAKDTVDRGVAVGPASGGAVAGGAVAGGTVAGGALAGNALSDNGVAPGGSTPVPGTKDVDPNAVTGKKDGNGESINTNAQPGAKDLDDDDYIPTGGARGHNRGQGSGGFDDDFSNQGGFQGNNGGGGNSQLLAQTMATTLPMLTIPLAAGGFGGGGGMGMGMGDGMGGGMGMGMGGGMGGDGMGMGMGGGMGGDGMGGGMGGGMGDGMGGEGGAGGLGGAGGAGADESGAAGDPGSEEESGAESGGLASPGNKIKKGAGSGDELSNDTTEGLGASSKSSSKASQESTGDAEDTTATEDSEDSSKSSSKSASKSSTKASQESTDDAKDTTATEDSGASSKTSSKYSS